MKYPIEFTKDDNNTWMVTSPDFAEFVTFGDTKEQAKIHAHDAFETVIEARIADREEIPAASEGHDLVTLSPLVSAKIALYQEMLQQNVRKSTLAQKLNWHLPQIDRLLNIRHSSKLEQLELAFSALGKTIEIRVI